MADAFGCGAVLWVVLRGPRGIWLWDRLWVALRGPRGIWLWFRLWVALRGPRGIWLGNNRSADAVIVR